MAMQNDNLSMHDELRQMKSDYEHLKADMDRQTIINRQLMEKVFRNNANVLDSNRRTALASISAAIVITLIASYINGVSLLIICMIVAFYVIMLTGYIFIYHRLGKIEYGTDDILSTVTRLRKFKRNYMTVNTVSWILLAALMCFILPEIHNSYRIQAQGIAAMAFMCAAILIGACFQYFTDRKVLKACDSIIDHLKDRP